MAKRIHVRPGKNQSKVAFVVGIIFCIMGVSVIIPTFGIFGIFWTAIAGWIAFSHYRNGFTDKPIDTRVIEIEDNGEDVVVTNRPGYHKYNYTVENDPSGNESAEDRLKELLNLYNQSLITREEYEKKKKEILDEL